jgi:hypothetical protein
MDISSLRPIGRAMALACLSLAAPATAGPPFVTDDPEPVDNGHWEVYAFSDGAFQRGAAPGARRRSGRCPPRACSWRVPGPCPAPFAT